MKEEFFGFYEPTKEEIDKSWTEGTFIFDANALLNLYRYSESTRKDFLTVIEKLSDKLFMPHQVGHEFHENRNSVIEKQRKSHSVLLSEIESLFKKSLEPIINQYKRHPSIQVESLEKLQSDFLKKVKSELEKQEKKHPDLSTKDETLDTITGLYKNKVGAEFTREELKKIYTEGEDRYKNQIPPGYKDADSKRKKGEKHMYGDLIIWKQMITHTLKNKNLVIFITDDRKEDWWTIDNGQTIRPREELIKEFYDSTNIRILIYSTDQFLKFAKERKLVTTIKEESIDEIKEIRKTDENLYENYRNYMKFYSNLDRSSGDLAKIISKLAIPDLSTPPGIRSIYGLDLYKKFTGININPALQATMIASKFAEGLNTSQLNIPIESKTESGDNAEEQKLIDHKDTPKKN